MITNPNKPPSIDAILQRAFGLTPAEVKMANALAMGETVTEYAQREQIGIATARTHVRSMLNKTGMRRQTDFLRLVANAGVIVTD